MPGGVDEVAAITSSGDDFPGSFVDFPGGGAITRIGIHSNQGSHCHFVGLVDGVTNIAKLFWCLAAKPKRPGHVGAVVLPSSPKVNENCGIFLEFGISGLMMGQGAADQKPLWSEMPADRSQDHEWFGR